MFRSLRFQLPALFFAGVIVFALVATAISFRLLAVVHHRPRPGRLAARGRRADAALRRAGDGVQRPGARTAARGRDGRPHLLRAGRARHRRRAAAAHAAEAVDRLRLGRAWEDAAIRPRAAGIDKTWLAVAQPLELGRKRGGSVFAGALVVTKPKDQLATQRGAAAGADRARAARRPPGGGDPRYFHLAAADASRARAFSRRGRGCARQLRRGGPSVRGGNEVSLLSNRFAVMARRLGEAEQLERNFLMSVSHELRTPLTAIRGHVAALQRGPRRG